MILTGVTRIGNDPTVRYTANGDAVIDLSLAYNHGKKQEDGKRPTQWVNASLWGQRAEKMAPYLTKGTQVFVGCSEVHVSSYDQKDGTKRYSLKAKIDVIDFVGGSKTENQEKVRENPVKTAGINELDDDIPF